MNPPHDPLHNTVRFPVEVKSSAIDGHGVFAKAAIPTRRKLGEFSGAVISQRVARRRARQLARIAIVEVGNGKAIDASQNGNAFRYVNHSCAPNTFIRIAAGRVEFYALRTIHPEEELTCDYGDSFHDGKLPCRCGASACRGFL